MPELVREQQGAFQLCPGMGASRLCIMASAIENRGLDRNIFLAEIVGLLDQRPEARNGFLRRVFPGPRTLARSAFAIRMVSGSLLRVAACRACAYEACADLKSPR